MKNKNYIVKGTPIVPSLCGIGLAVLWYTFFYFYGGEWSFNLNSLSFAELSGAEIYFTVQSLLMPVVFFIGVLFLAELDVRWMILTLLFPVAEQISLFVYNVLTADAEYMFEYPLYNPVQFVAPFLALILFALTIEKVLLTKWIFVGFCGVAVLLPLILTFCGVGEFTFSQQGYDAEYNVITRNGYLWSNYLSFALQYVGLGALAIQMRPPRESDFPATETQEAEESAESEEIVSENT